MPNVTPFLCKLTTIPHTVDFAGAHRRLSIHVPRMIMGQVETLISTTVPHIGEFAGTHRRLLASMATVLATSSRKDTGSCDTTWFTPTRCFRYSTNRRRNATKCSALHAPCYM